MKQQERRTEKSFKKTMGEKKEKAEALLGQVHSGNYVEPDYKFDEALEATQDYIDTLPDIQNGSPDLIMGAPVKIQRVGIHNFRLPLKYKKREGGVIELETAVTGTVSLEADKAGINMSRIMREFYEYKDDEFSIDHVGKVLEGYKKRLGSFEAKICLSISYPIVQKSLRSGLEGYQYYKVTIEGDMDKNGKFTKYLHFDFVYSSACPCSFELAEHARQFRNKASVPHSQRSKARISVKFEDFVWIEDLQEICLDALKTETQVMVKREDEQAFAEMNGSYTKFVEDAARLLYDKLNKDPRILDFKACHSHLESLHSHDAISVIVKGIEGGFDAEVPDEIWDTLVC